MEVNMYSYPPGDPQLTERIYNEFLSQGRFDRLRKECMANADTKPAYQNLQQRVENTVTQFLRKQTWKPDLNKNQLRDQLRKHILESGFLESGINRIVDQVVNPNVLATMFLPEVEEVVCSYFNIPRPTDRQKKNSTSFVENDMNPPGVVETNDLKSENDADSKNQNVDSEGSKSEILFDRLKKEDEDARRDSKDLNFENELKEKKSNINDSTESLFEKISNESFSLEEKSDAGNNDSKEIIPSEDLPDSLTVGKMELPSDDSQESLSRMGVEKLQINELDNPPNGHDSDSQGPLEIDERTMSDSENSNDSILQQMSPISQGRMSPDPELNLELEIKQEPKEQLEESEDKQEIKQESDKPKERLPILEEKNPSTFVGRIPKIKKEDEEEKSKDKPEVKSADSSDDSGSANKSDFDDKKKAEEKKDEKSRDRYKDDKKQRDDKSRRKDEKSRRDRSRDRDRDRDRKRDDKSKNKDDKDKDKDRDKDKDKDRVKERDRDRDRDKDRDRDRDRDKDKDKDKDRSRSDKSRDRNDKKPSSSSSHRSSSSSHRKSSHRDDSKSRDKDRSKYDKKEKEKDKDKDKRNDDKNKRKDDKKKKSKTVDDHSKERKKDDRRSNDRDSNDRDKSSSTTRSQGESSRRKDKETKGDGSSKEKYGKDEKEKTEKKKDTMENEVKAKPDVKEEKLERMEIIDVSSEILPKNTEIPLPDLLKTEQVEENMEKMFSPELPIEIIPPPETSQNLPPPETPQNHPQLKEELSAPKLEDCSPNVNFSDLLKEGVIKKYTFPTVADDFYQKFNSVGFKYFEDWESKEYFEFYDCEDEFREYVQRAENDLSLISDDDSDSENDFKEMNSVTVKNSANGLGNFDSSLMFNPASGDFYSWTNKIAFENALNGNQKNPLVVPHIETDEDEQTKEEKNKENQELKKSKKKSNKPKKPVEDAQKSVLKHLTDGLIKNETAYKEIFKTDDTDVQSALEPEIKLNEVPNENISLPLSEDNELGKTSEEPAISNSKTPSSLLEDDNSDPSGKEPPKMDVDAKTPLLQFQSQRRQRTPSQNQRSRILTRLSSSKSDESSDLEHTDEKPESFPVEKTRGKRKSSVEVDETSNKKLTTEANAIKPKSKPKIRCGLPRPKSKVKAPGKDVDSPVNNFNLPLSPESDDTPLNNGAPNPVINKRKRAPFTSPNIGAIPLKKNMESEKKRALQQKYDSQDLYKPRPVLTGSRTRNRSLGIDSPTTKADSVQNKS